jgi:hypothetical protein
MGYLAVTALLGTSTLYFTNGSGSAEVTPLL